MHISEQFSTFLKTLIITLCFCAVCATAQPIEEEVIQIRYRTFGWGIMKTVGISDSAQPAKVEIRDNNFSQEYTYTGIRHIRFYSGKSKTPDEWMPSSQTKKSLTANSPKNTAQSSKNVTPPLAEISIPKGMKKVLLIFFKSSPGSKLPFQVAAIDDSLAEISNRNVHFYNLSSVKLAVKTFDKVKMIAPGKQARWVLAPDEKKSSIMIAVTSPKNKVIYSNLFRLRDGQRMVFFARKLNDLQVDGTPKLLVTPLLSQVSKAQVDAQKK